MGMESIYRLPVASMLNQGNDKKLTKFKPRDVILNLLTERTSLKIVKEHCCKTV